MKKTILTIVLALAAIPVFADEPKPAPTPTTLETALVDILNSVTATAGQAKDFLVDQTPDVIRQLLAWKMAESIAYDVVAVLVLVALIVNTRMYVKYIALNGFEKPKSYDLNPVSMSWTILGAAGTIVGVCTFFAAANLNWLQIWLAPKIYLIEYAKSLIH